MNPYPLALLNHLILPLMPDSPPLQHAPHDRIRDSEALSQDRPGGICLRATPRPLIARDYTKEWMAVKAATRPAQRRTSWYGRAAAKGASLDLRGSLAEVRRPTRPRRGPRPCGDSRSGTLPRPRRSGPAR